MKSLSNLVRGFGPGIFAIGYTIGTGSVTSMIVAGNSFGMELLWVLVLSCLFTGTLIYVSGSYYLLTNETLLYALKRHLPIGKFVAIAILVSVGVGQWNSLVGILGITSNVIFELIAIYFPQLQGYSYLIVLGLAILIIGSFYYLMIRGNYSSFEKVLTVFVFIMAISFLFTLIFVFPLPSQIILGLIPEIPNVSGAGVLVAAFVGTTMASATFVSRPMFVQGKEWTIDEYAKHRKDSITAAILIFVVSGAIMGVASGSMFGQEREINSVLDMSATLEPAAGKFAVSIFFAGTLCAGLSSIFPCLMIVPLMIGDFRAGKLDVSSVRFKVITAIASVLALSIPLFGFNPIKGQIFTQVINVFALPLVILSLLILWNRRSVRVPGNRWGINVIMLGALIFALIIMYNGLVDIFS